MVLFCNLFSVVSHASSLVNRRYRNAILQPTCRILILSFFSLIFLSCLRIVIILLYTDIQTSNLFTNMKLIIYHDRHQCTRPAVRLHTFYLITRFTVFHALLMTVSDFRSVNPFGYQLFFQCVLRIQMQFSSQIFWQLFFFIWKIFYF